jgi:15-cis-phytoene synthase
MSAEPLTLATADGAKASNLALALTSLPRDRRDDALVFYAFCRAVDDIADDPGHTPVEKSSTLRAWTEALQTQKGLPAELAAIMQRRALPPDLLVAIVRGMEMDIEPRRYFSYADLQTYCWPVACAVGQVSVRIFGCHRPESSLYADELGYALQLTNILRDVAEDARMGRIYLPIEDLQRFGVSEASLLAGRPDGDFRGLMAVETVRARAHFAAAAKALHPEDREALVAADIMRRTYEKLLNRLEADGYRVFERRYRLSKWEKLWILLSGIVQNRFAKISRRAGGAE